MTPMRIFLMVLGTLSLIIGLIGIVVPGLPTTPFVLLTAGLYIRSSDRLYNRLISSRFVGSYIHDFQIRKGMTRKTKILAIGLMWFMILISTLFFLKAALVSVAVIVVGLTGTIVMGFIIRTVPESDMKE